MSLLHIAGGATEDRLYVEDVFSTYLYNGNDSTQTINNGIDLAGKGGLVWFKRRDTGGASHCLFDTTRGTKSILYSNTTSASFNMTSTSQYDLTSFNNNGFTLGAMYDAQLNVSGYPYASWTFRKAPKFFDVVTYTGDGVASRAISHSLGQEPGMIIVKRTDSTGNWIVYHRSTGNTKYSYLQLTDAFASTINQWANTSPTTSTFTVSSSGNLNGSGVSYVAYLFAHDPSADGIIQCGSFTTDASGNASVNLGWEPQFIISKAASTTGYWAINDCMRGAPVGSSAASLFANVSDAESAGYQVNPTATGFNPTGAVSQTYIYLAIRRPMKVPTSGREVYGVRTASGAETASGGVGLVPDAIFSKRRTGSTLSFVTDRLRGLPTSAVAVPTLRMESTAAESSIVNDYRWGVPLGGASQWMDYLQWDTTADGGVGHVFRRAKGFFDVVCYTGNGSEWSTFKHQLGVTPNLIICKLRNGSRAWGVWWYNGANSIFTNFELNTADAPTAAGILNDYPATATTFTPGRISGGDVAANFLAGEMYVAYLFASLPGISKVGSYTGNGTSQTINCGFSTGARFVLCKRTDSTGDWYIWDTARGIVAANDPHLSLNTTAAEVTTDDSVDPASSGFIVNQNTATNINVLNGTYIFLAIA